MKKQVIAFFLWAGIFSVAWGQGSAYTEITRITAPGASCFTLDNLGNLYVANERGDLVKYDKNGKQIATANIKSYGSVHSIDASNAFEIYVFYKEQNRVLLFDNLLNIRVDWDFEQAGFVMMAAVARSFDNKLWVFDLNDLRLKKVTKELNVEFNSGNVRAFANASAFNPSYIGDDNRSVYLFDSLNGLYVFDNFGNYQKRITLSNVSQVCIHNGRIYFLRQGTIRELDTLLLNEKTVFEGPLSTTSFAISKDRMVLHSGNELILHVLTQK
jgi:hypothetical protein